MAEGASGKKEKVTDLLAERPSLSVQAINEMIAVLRRKKLLSTDETAGIARDFFRVCEIFPLTVSDVQTALDLSRRHQFSHWDALIVANALNNGGTLLYPEDFQNGMRLQEGLTIINPFLE
jgi:predicted nucleic acid-binding protein